MGIISYTVTQGTRTLYSGRIRDRGDERENYIAAVRHIDRRYRWRADSDHDRAMRGVGQIMQQAYLRGEPDGLSAVTSMVTIRLKPGRLG